jgi:hypothetical protein
VWEEAGLEYTVGDTDTVDVEIYVNWMFPRTSWTSDTVTQLEERDREVQPGSPKQTHMHTQTHTHTSHATREEDEQRTFDTEGHVHDGQEYAESGKKKSPRPLLRSRFIV